MIDYKKLIDRYLKIIEIKGEPNERYKYDAIQHFQENWNIDSDDFYSMFKKAFAKKGNLFYQNSWGFIEKAAKYFPDFTKSMFLNLYDENQDIEKRIKKFQVQSDEILLKIRERLNRTNLNAQQDERTISVYLTFRFPETYIFYLYKYYKQLSKEFELPDVTNQNFHYLLSILPEFKKKLHESKFFLEKYRNLYSAPSWNDENLMIQNILYVTYLNNLSDLEIIDNNSTEMEYFDVDGIVELTKIDQGNVRQDTFMKLEYLKEQLEKEIGIKFSSANHITAVARNPNSILEIRFQPLNVKDSSFEIIMGFGDEYNDADYESKTFFGLVVGSQNTKLASTINDEFAVYLNIDDFPDDWKSLIEVLKLKLEAILKELEINISPTLVKINKMKAPVNQILYGPPGTGKTYNTINKAISIANPEFDLKQDRALIKQEYCRLVDTGQILFTTFHQSMSYEDFIEGIKPKSKNEIVTYSVKDGIFKSLVKKALIEYIRKEEDIDSPEDYDSLYSSFIESIKPLEGKRQGTFTTKTGVEMMLVDANDTSILVKYLWSNKKKDIEGQHTFSVTKEKLKKVLVEEIIPDNVSNLKAELHPLIGHIHCELFAVYKKFYDFVLDKKGEIDSIHFDYEVLSFKEIKEQFDLLSKKEINTKKVQPFIIIIDEINRGNVSQIFGELITLIEKDKRLGKEEFLEVTLPYSEDKFGIPPNVFFIGTMNTADRSVEALDTALRRRFSFEEILSNPNLIATEGKAKESLGVIETIELPKVLETINHRIEILSNRDHKIGHAYFLNVTTLKELRETFKKNIIPLLQEYFYNDYEKIGWVIGEGFFEEKKIDKKVIFSKFFKAQKPEFDVSYQLADIDTIDIKAAMLQLLGTVEEVKQSEESAD